MTCSRLFPLSLYLTILASCAVPPASDSNPKASPIVAEYSAVADKLMTTALADSFAYNRLAELTDTFGPRFSGTKNLEDAIDWILEEMKKDGFENVHGEEVMIPRWVRGEEWVRMEVPWKKEMAMLGLGGSVATPGDGITAEVLVVDDFEELQRRAGEAKGKIVLFNAPFTNYGKTVRYRYDGASAAAEAGAVASLIRSVGPYSMNTPHTGAMGYKEGIPKIPHAAITVEDAMMLGRLADRGESVVLSLYMEAHFEDDVPSRNVVGELRGSEKPEEVVVLGGHIDSWDVGQGAMDDAGGCVAAWQAVKLMKDLGLRPRRTVRVVMWTNEENGLRGGNAYHDAHQDELKNHVLAMESDSGVFKPSGFGFTGSDRAREIIEQIASFLDPIEAGEISPSGGGADIGPIMKEGVPGMGLNVNGSKYFWYHHTNADTMDKLDPHNVNLCVAAMAVMAYVVADLPETLPR